MTHSLDEVTPLRWRAAELADLPEIHSLLTAVSAFDDTTQRWGPEELEEWYSATGELASDLIVIGFEGGSMVAVGWNVTETTGTIRLDGAVHPAFRHQGIGRQLFRWQLDRARDWFLAFGDGPDVCHLAFSDASMSNKRSMFEHAGLRATRWLIDMVCTFPLTSRVAEFVVTPVLGVRFEQFSDRWVEPTREAHNAAFADRWGARPVGPEDWIASLAVEHARPELSWVAIDELERVVGYALNSSASEPGGPSIGWTDRLGVRPEQRGRNIARVLLARSLDSFRRAGKDAGGVGLDSVDGGGTTLYRSLGYEATDTIIQYELHESREQARAALDN